MAQPAGRVLVESREGIARITLDNPPMNPVDAAIYDQLLGALERLAEDPGVRVLVLTGAGHQSFCAGADVRWVAAVPPSQVEEFATRWDLLYQKLRDFPAPVIAAVNGYALGGGFEILLSCDLRIAAAHARMGCTAANLGLVTSTNSLVRQVGEPMAKELFFTARHVSASEALHLGLVNRVVPADRLAGEVAGVVAAILARAPQAIRLGKALMNRALDLPREIHDLAQRRAFVELSSTADTREAVRAFLEKRPPRFTGA